MRQKTSLNLIGWYGAFAILIAYSLTSLNLISPQHPAFPLLNLSGSLSLLFIAFHHRAHQLTVVNIAWALIAIYNLTLIWLK